MYPIRAKRPSPFDMAALLAPISPDAPAGESLRYEGTYDRIGQARIEDDPVLAQGVWKVALKRADWPNVAKMCIEAIETKSKDLQVAAWLTEALVHINGFAGMNDGLRAITALCDTYWDTLFPRSDPEDIEYKLAPLVWINEKIPVLLKLLPITSPQSDDSKPYCWADWEIACRPLPPGTGKGKSEVSTQAMFQQSAMLPSTEHFVALLADVEASMDAVDGLESFFQDRCDDQAPSLRQIWKVLESVRGFMVSTLSQRNVPAAFSPVADAVAPPDGSALDPSAGEYTGPIRNRADAYRRLAEAADYLARTEPHSPAPYLVRRAIAWGSMRLEDLLPELVTNNSELGEIFRLLQIDKKQGK